MNNAGYTRATIILSVICIGLAAAGVTQFFKHGMLGLRVAFADEQIEVFHEMRGRAQQANLVEAVRHLDYVVGYYPSGTKQPIGSRLDRIVERARASAIRDMIADLRIKTGEDLGDDAEAWISNYSTEPKPAQQGMGLDAE